MRVNDLPGVAAGGQKGREIEPVTYRSAASPRHGALSRIIAQIKTLVSLLHLVYTRMVAISECDTSHLIQMTASSRDLYQPISVCLPSRQTSLSLIIPSLLRTYFRLWLWWTSLRYNGHI